MSDSKKPQRNFWQFHLSTAVILIIFAGVFIRANLTNRIPDADERYIQVQYGWPLAAYERRCLRDDANTGLLKWDRMAVIVNSLAGITLLLFAVVVSEWLIRRREARKT